MREFFPSFAFTFSHFNVRQKLLKFGNSGCVVMEVWVAQVLDCFPCPVFFCFVLICFVSSWQGFLAPALSYWPCGLPPLSQPQHRYVLSSQRWVLLNSAINEASTCLKSEDTELPRMIWANLLSYECRKRYRSWKTCGLSDHFGYAKETC